MKLFVVAALIAVSSAARLEHLEHQHHQQLREYLPPDHGSGFGPHDAVGAHSGPHGAVAGSHAVHAGSHAAHVGSHGHAGSFGGQPGAFASAGAGQPSAHAVAGFPGASNQYLAPDQGPSASSSAGQTHFDGAVHGHEHGSHIAQNTHEPQIPPQAIPIHQLLNPHVKNPNTYDRYQQQIPSHSGSHQPSGPHGHSAQEVPQQSFDARTGYHY
ncbi:uncharacterized protein LOC142979885 [Anticarsia gemmatalis]|uniref:uncharacterized protein LOC142979885 n=1 Tax=Anticarsia gemmatalis TaxID=129554 RepID=UPI003F769C70